MQLTRSLDAEKLFTGTVLVFNIDGALDGLEATSFLEQVQTAYTECSPRAVVLFCEDMPYLTSSGLRAIMTIGKTLLAGSGKLVLCALSGLALEIVTTSGFTQVFPSVASLEEARALLEGGQ